LPGEAESFALLEARRIRKIFTSTGVLEVDHPVVALRAVSWQRQPGGAVAVGLKSQGFIDSISVVNSRSPHLPSLDPAPLMFAGGDAEPGPGRLAEDTCVGLSICRRVS